MTEARQQRIATLGAGTAVVLIALCIVVLTISYVIGRAAKPRDDGRILALQEQVATDAAMAPELAAEHDRHHPVPPRPQDARRYRSPSS